MCNIVASDIEFSDRVLRTLLADAVFCRVPWLGAGQRTQFSLPGVGCGRVLVGLAPSYIVSAPAEMHNSHAARWPVWSASLNEPVR